MEMDRKKLIAIAAIVVAVIVVAGAWIGAKPSDQDDLRKQQAAGGRPDPSQMRKQIKGQSWKPSKRPPNPRCAQCFSRHRNQARRRTAWRRCKP